MIKVNLFFWMICQICHYQNKAFIIIPILLMKTILLIEDNREMRENTAEILELSNYKILTADNGRTGVDMAKTHLPDLIICDVMMPELDGFGVLYILSKEPKTAGIPFIFLTAKAEKSDMRKGMNMGADDYLTKPFDDVELLDAIESRLRKSQILRMEFETSASGLDAFFKEAKNLTDLSQLAFNRKHRTFKKKSVIYYEGDHPNSLLYINKGKIKTYKTNEDGKEYITGIHAEGTFLGYIALLKDTMHAETAMALEDAEVSIIPKEDFLSLLYGNRDVSNKFIKMLSNEVHEMEDKMLKLAYSSVRQRVAEALLSIDSKYTEGDTDTKMVITRDDLAKIVGTAKETLIRTLSDFKEEKLIEIRDKNISILNKPKLQKLSH